MNYLLATFFLIFPMVSSCAVPNCSDKNAWPSKMAFVYLKNNGYLTNESTDFDKTNVKLIASENKGNDIYKQVHHVSYFDFNGAEIAAFTVNDVSNTECSEGRVEVYVIQQALEK